MEKATTAINALEVKHLAAIKALAQPPTSSLEVLKAVLILYAG
jgi:hypothetical protein